MNDKIKINLQIAETNYPVSIHPQNEEIVRKAARQVNDKINEFRTKWPVLSLEMILAMVAHEFSLDQLLEKEKNDTVPYTEKIAELTEMLEDYFEKESF